MAGVDNGKTTQFAEYTNDQLFALYRSTGRLDVKQELAMRYLYVVRSIALQMRNVYIGFEQVEDIVNEGVLTLMKAIDRFEADKNVKFETYISKRIRGMIVDIARKQDWVPRAVRKTYKKICDLRDSYYALNGVEPTVEEICQTLDLTEEKYKEIMSKSAFFLVLSLDMALEEAAEHKKQIAPPTENPADLPEATLLTKEVKGDLLAGLQTLKEKEQLVVSLYYVDEISMKDIAKILDVSEPRVSQIHAAAIKKLRQHLIGQDEAKTVTAKMG